MEKIITNLCNEQETPFILFTTPAAYKCKNNAPIFPVDISLVNIIKKDTKILMFGKVNLEWNMKPGLFKYVLHLWTF